MRWIAILFIAVPLCEMLLLFAVADRIGGLWTLSLVVLTAIIGVQILRWQGLATLFRANQRLASGQIPALEIIEGMLLAAAGALLLTPGFITDTIGFMLLTASIRKFLARAIVRAGWLKTMGKGPVHSTFYTSGEAFKADMGDLYEGELEADKAELENPRENPRE